MTILYRAGRPVLSRVVREFFRSITVLGAPPCREGPVLVVPNHPNHALDPFLVVATYPRELWFLAKSTLFRSPLLAAFLRWAHLVPVYRRQDNEDPRKNDESLRFASQSLENGRAVVIFPEGTSTGERKLNPVKTGAARIALQAEAAANFALGLQIQAIGLNYGDFVRFGATVTVVRGEPFQVGEFREVYAIDPVRAVRELTGRIEDAIERVTVNLPELSYQRLIEQIARVYQATRPTTDDRTRFELVAKNVLAIAPGEPERVAAIRAKLERYELLADSLGFDAGIPLPGSSDHAPWWWTRVVLLLALSPLVALGAAINAVPYRVVHWKALRVAHDPVVIATTKLANAVVVFSIWYLAISLLVGVWMESIAVGLGVGVVLILLGMFTNRFFTPVRGALLSLVGRLPGHPFQSLRQLHGELIAEFEEVRIA